LCAHGRLRIDLLCAHEEAAWRKADRPAQRRMLVELSASTLIQSDDERCCDLQRRSYRFAIDTGDVELAERSLADLERRSLASGKPQLRALSLLLHAQAALYHGDFAAAADRASQARELFEAAGDVDHEVECLTTLIDGTTFGGPNPQAAEAFERARQLAAAQGNALLLVGVLRGGILAAWMRNDAEAMKLLGCELTEAAQSIGDRLSEANAQLGLGIAARLRFKISDARSYLERALQMFEVLGDPVGIAGTLLERAGLESNAGCCDAAERFAERAAALCRASGYTRGTVAYVITMAKINNDRGRFDAARGFAMRALATPSCRQPNRFRTWALAELAAAELEAGDTAQALNHVAEGLRLVSRLGSRSDALADALADAALAHLAAGEIAAAQQHADELVALIDRDPQADTRSPVHLWAAARVCAASGATERARLLQARSADAFRQRLESLPDEPTRSAFFKAWFNRELRGLFQPADKSGRYS
jgi:tetratricopeptide (TPR) repeat protein